MTAGKKGRIRSAVLIVRWFEKYLKAEPGRSAPQ
jgi:hypothetical protein